MWLIHHSFGDIKMSFTTSQNETPLDLLNEYEVAPVVKKSVSWLRRARVSG